MAPPCPSPIPTTREIYVLKRIWIWKTKIGKITIDQPQFFNFVGSLIAVVKTLCLWVCFKRKRLHEKSLTREENNTKVIRANLLDFAFALDFYFEDIFKFDNISVLVTFQFW